MYVSYSVISSIMAMETDRTSFAGGVQLVLVVMMKSKQVEVLEVVPDRLWQEPLLPASTVFVLPKMW